MMTTIKLKIVGINEKIIKILFNGFLLIIRFCYNIKRFYQLLCLNYFNNLDKVI